MLDYETRQASPTARPEAVLNGPAAVAVHGLSYAYPNGHVALRDVSLTIQAGERVVRVDGHGGDGEHGRRPYACRTRC